jgi:steroid delta-isomerase-like uncharacterized protein
MVDYAETVKEILHAMMDNVNILESYLAEDVTFWSANYEIHGKDNLLQIWNDYFKVMKPKSLEIIDTISQGNKVSCEFRGTCTHVGEWQGIPATGKDVEWLMVYIFEFENGKIKTWKDYFNIKGYSDMQTEQYLKS